MSTLDSRTRCVDGRTLRVSCPCSISGPSVPIRCVFRHSHSTIDRDRLAIHNAEDAHLNGHGVVMMRTNHRAMKLNLF